MATNDRTMEFHSPQTLMAAANRLPNADSREIFWDDPKSEEVSRTEIPTHKAVFNPENGDLYNVVTEDYQIINPPTFMGPLVEEITERDRTDVNGAFHVRDGGASGYGEMLFDTARIWPADRNRSDEPVRCGLTIRYSHDGGISVRASGFAQDGMCRNTMRRVTNSVYVKHAGDVDSRVDWNQEWGDVLDQLGAFSESLAMVIEEAMDHTLFNFGEDQFSDDWVAATDPQSAIEEVPAPVGVEDRSIEGLHGFYDFLGFSGYLALAATDRLSWRMSQRDDTRVVSAWDAYSAATYALTHERRFDQGSSSDDNYHRAASEILTNPLKAREDAEMEARRRLRPDMEQDTLGGVEDSVGEALLAYEQREKKLRGSLGD